MNEEHTAAIGPAPELDPEKQEVYDKVLWATKISAGEILDVIDSKDEGDYRDLVTRKLQSVVISALNASELDLARDEILHAISAGGQEPMTT